MVVQRPRAHSRLLVERRLQSSLYIPNLGVLPNTATEFFPLAEMAHQLCTPRSTTVKNHLVGKAKEFGLRQVSERQTLKFEK